MFKTIRTQFLVLSALILTSLPATAAEVKVIWQEPDEYTDIREGFAYTRSGFQKHVFTMFEKFLIHRAAKLPEGQTLKMTVTDLDLAGETRFNFDEIRIIKPHYIPRIKFNYLLLDKSGKELISGEEELKNMSMSTHYLTKPSEEQFKYEFHMLNDWFKKTFPEVKF